MGSLSKRLFAFFLAWAFVASTPAYVINVRGPVLAPSAGGGTPTITSVTPSTFADGDTGIVIAGTNFGASQGGGTVTLSPADNILGSYNPRTIGAGAQTVTNTGGATLSPAYPAGYTAVAGDVCAVILVGRPNGSTITNTVSGGAGYNLKGSQFLEIGAGATDLWVGVYTRTLTAAEAAPTVTPDADFLPGSTTGGVSAQILILADVTETLDVAAATNTATAAATWTPPSVTTSTANCMIISAVGTADDNALNYNTANSFATDMTGANYDTTTGSDHAAGAGTLLKTAAGAVTMPVWNQSAVGNDVWAGVTLAFQPVARYGAIAQTVTAWSDSSITITSAQSTLSSGTNYAFVTNNSALSNSSGSAVTLTSPAVRSFSATTYASRTNTTITAPSGITDGDLLVAVHLVGLATAPTVTAPAGWTRATGFPRMYDNGFQVSCAVYYKTAASEAGNYTWTHSAASSDGFIYCISNPSTATPQVSRLAGTGTTSTAPTLLTTTNNAVVIFADINFNAYGSSSPPAGTTPTFTERRDSASGLIYAADGILSTAGWTGDKTHGNNNGASDPWQCIAIAVSAEQAGTVDAIANFETSSDGTTMTDTILDSVWTGRFGTAWQTISDPDAQTPGATSSITIETDAARGNGNTYYAGGNTVVATAGTRGMRVIQTANQCIQTTVPSGAKVALSMHFRWNGAAIDSSPRDIVALRSDPSGNYQMIQGTDGATKSLHAHWQPTAGSGEGSDVNISAGHWYRLDLVHVDGGGTFTVTVYDAENSYALVGSSTGAVTGTAIVGATTIQIGTIRYAAGAGQSFDYDNITLNLNGTLPPVP